MFHSAIVRLTLWYLMLVMLLSIFFSLILYRVSTSELNRSLGRQTIYFHTLPNQFTINFNQLEQLREQQIEEIKERLKVELIDFNLLVLLVSGLASYWLARRTLGPIKEALDAQNRFTADASHELRTPLTAMQTEIEVALRDKNFTLTQARSLFVSNLEEIARLTHLASNLLTLAGRQPTLDPSLIRPCSLRDVVDQATTCLKPLIKKKGISLEENIAETSVDGDQKSLVELVTILLDNAIKYSEKDKKVTIMVAHDNRQATLRIQDEGIGISTKDLPHIFDRFYRVDPSRSTIQTDGHGLGLSIAKRIVELHQGQIGATSVLNEGSIFTVQLPLHQKRKSNFN